jgi:16S rRNA (uracil1498-N3)-methyltransferase
MTAPRPASARRLRVPVDAIEPGDRSLPQETAIYVARVHRLSVNDTFVAFDPERAIEADARITSITAAARAVTIHIDDVRPASVRAARSVTLVQALGKGDKMDAIVRDATELGATRVVPVLSERSVVRPDDAAGRARRWRKIAVEAARQSGRGDAPTIDAPEPLSSAIARLAAEQAVPLAGVCLAPAAPTHLGDYLYTAPPTAPFTVVVGPEGGLSAAEISACESAGITGVTLGPLVLRTETVCAAVLGALLVLGAHRRE